MRVAEQRRFLQRWQAAAIRSGGFSSAEHPLAAQVMVEGVVNPTVAAFVVALGQQLDIADAAVQAIEVCAGPVAAH